MHSRDLDDTKEINSEGVKVTPTLALCVFVNGEEDINTILEKPQWLKALGGAKLKENFDTLP